MNYIKSNEFFFKITFSIPVNKSDYGKILPVNKELPLFNQEILLKEISSLPNLREIAEKHFKISERNFRLNQLMN